MHDGFKISALATINRINAKSDKDFRSLVDRALAIPNAADKAVTLGLIARCIPVKYQQFGLNTWDQAKNALREIPSDYDRIGRCIWLAELAKDADSNLARFFINDAFLTLTRVDSDDVDNDDYVSSLRRRIIDVAHNVDENFADKLVEKFDDDEVRAKARLEAKHQLNLAKARKSLVRRESDSKLEQIELHLLPEAAWSCLGSLNSNRVTARKHDTLLGFLQQSAFLPLDDAFPVLSWIIENIGKRLGTTDNIKDIMPALFETTLIAAELAANLVGKLAVDDEFIGSQITSANTSSFVVGPGDREEAIKYITNWLHDTVSDDILVCDPYFDIDCLEYLQLINSEKPECTIKILTELGTEGNTEKLNDKTIEDAWKLLTDDPQPEIIIILVGRRGDGKIPIHDRWWLSDKSGLRIGTSVKSIGGWRLSELSKLDFIEINKIWEQLIPLIRMERDSWDGVRLNYRKFSTG